MFERFSKLLPTVLILLIINVVPEKLVHAQDIDLTVEPSALIQDAQVLSFTELGVSTDGSGPVLVAVTIENQSDQLVEDLFLEIIVSSAQKGTLLEYTQEANRPFSLRPYQSVYITNNDVANERFPGIDETVSFSGGLTPQGDDLIGELSGSTILPQDTYSLEVTIFTVSDAHGREILASDVAEIGLTRDARSGTIEESEIILRAPGDIIGNQTEITNPYPQFSWEGSGNVTYRLIVVEDNEQDSPETLLQSATSSEPLADGGSLLEFENLDTYVQGNDYQFPTSGVQSLERGKTYFWQVRSSIRSSSSQNVVLSEAWSFTLIDPAGQANTPSGQNAALSQETRRVLIELLGQESFRRLQEQGFRLEAVEYDGQQFSGASASLKLEELLQKIQDEEIILQEN